MASTAKEKKYARKYYRDNAAYRREKIDDRKKDAKQHKQSEAEYSKAYYHSHPEYRKYKIRYATDYRKAHKKNTNK